MKLLARICCLLFLTATAAGAATMAIESLSGPVTQNEINSFKTYMLTQVPAPTPWGALNGSGHNDWADGPSGNALEAFGLMYELSGDISILTNMIHWTDICVSERNDLMAATNGGQRVMWTGNINKVWVPNALTIPNPTYAGAENGDTKAHIAYTALLILQRPSLWNQTVPDGNPYGYGVTYFQRATNYVAKCDEGHDDYDHIFYTASNTIRNPSNWPSGFHTMEANNIQMMLLGYLERLAQCHEIMGDNPARVAQYDAIVKSAATECINGMAGCHPSVVSNHTVYAWCYYPWDTFPSHLESVGHAAYDMVGVYRAFNRVSYGFTLSSVAPFANAEAYVMNVAANSFSGNVDGTGTTQNYMQAQWLMLADWNPAVYDVTAPANLASGRYKTTTLMDATMLWMKNRRYQQFSVTPSPLSRTVAVGAGTAFTLTVAPLGGFTNVVSLAIAGLPPGATGVVSSSSINLAALNFASSNVTLSINTSTSTPAGTYALSVIGTSGSVSHTNTVNLTVGNFSLLASPPSQVVSVGNSANYTVSVTTNSGFSGSVSFGVSGLGPNMSAGFSPGSLNGAGNSTLTVTTSNNTPAGSYTLTLAGTNGAVVADATVNLVVVGVTPVWTGGSSSGSYWSDTANWGGVALTPGSPLIFSGTSRLNNTNNTAAVTTYSNTVFSAGAGAFVLNGNPITLTGNVTNNSANPQTIALGLNFNTGLIFNGASNTLIIAGGLTNTFGAPGSTTVTLAGSGILKNLLKSTASPGGTNLLLMGSSTADWTLVDNDTSAPMTVPWAFAVNNGMFSFGTEGSAPILTTTTPNGSPQDNQVGALSGGVGTFNMVAGTLTTSSRFNTATAANSTGIINQSGGTMNIGSQFQGANGSNPGEVSFVNISGGTMNIGSAANPNSQFYVASRGSGTLTVSDSGVLSCGKLDISRNAQANTVGIVNLDGGELRVNSVTNISANQQTTGSPTATFNFDGGTLTAKAGALAMFFQGSLVTPITPIRAYVKSGGAIINDGGINITIGEPLLHDAALGGAADGGLTKLGTGVLTLISNNTYNGDTMVTSGTLALSGAGSISNSATINVASGATLDASVRIGGTLTLASGQTLAGNGALKGNVVAGNGATIAPGNSIGMLTFSNNLTLNAGSTTAMDVDQTMATNDVVRVIGSLTYGGTLLLTIEGTLSATDSFKLFSAANYSGAFANIDPAVPGPGLVWNTNNLTVNGTLSVVAVTPPRIGSISIAGGTVTLSGSNGLASAGYSVLGSTNVALPLSGWSLISTGAFDSGGLFTFTNAIDPGVSQRFYQLRVP